MIHQNMNIILHSDKLRINQAQYQFLIQLFFSRGCQGKVERIDQRNEYTDTGLTTSLLEVLQQIFTSGQLTLTIVRGGKSPKTKADFILHYNTGFLKCILKHMKEWNKYFYLIILFKLLCPKKKIFQSLKYIFKSIAKDVLFRQTILQIFLVYSSM